MVGEVKEGESDICDEQGVKTVMTVITARRAVTVMTVVTGSPLG